MQRGLAKIHMVVSPGVYLFPSDHGHAEVIRSSSVSAVDVMWGYRTSAAPKLPSRSRALSAFTSGLPILTIHRELFLQKLPRYRSEGIDMNPIDGVGVVLAGLGTLPIAAGMAWFALKALFTCLDNRSA
jgi:hypothetical protein